MLNWQIGKKYKRRDGVIVTCVRLPIKEIVLVDIEEVYQSAYFVNGSQWDNNMLTGKSTDIIEEVKENEMKIEVGKWYKSYYDGKVHIVHYNKDVPDPFFLDAFGNKYFEKEISEFLIEEWKEPKSGVVYLNVYKDDTTDYAYMNRTMADDAARDVVRLACVRVEWKEGQFDD